MKDECENEEEYLSEEKLCGREEMKLVCFSLLENENYPQISVGSSLMGVSKGCVSRVECVWRADNKDEHENGVS